MKLYKNEQLYSKENGWLNTMLEGFDSVAILILDQSYKYIMLNNGHKKFMKRLLGIDVKIGMNILDIIEKYEKNNMKENFIGRIKEKVSIAFKGKSIITNEEVLVKQSEIEYYQIELVPIKDEKGNIIQIGICSLNITDNINTMKYLLKRKLDISEEYKEKYNFLRNISHEIRTPMNGIVGLTDILLKDDLDTKQKKYMNAIKDSATALLENVDNILYNCKTGVNKLPVNYKEFTVHKLMNSIQNMFSAKQQEMKLNINYNIDKNVDKCVIGNELKLQQVLINIMSIAINLSACSQIQVNVKVQEKFMNYNNKHGIKLKFEILYLGKKINERKNKECFNSYEVTRQLIKDINGDIGISNDDCFKNNIYIIIPFILCDKVKKNIKCINNDDQIKMKSIELKNENKIKILVAEDNLVNQMVINELIRMFGWKSNIVNNGKKAIEALKNDNYDLILMDISMPEMNGVEAMRVIKQEKRFKKIPIIALTAYALEEDKEKLIQLGMDDYLSKPIDKEKLYEMVNKHLKLSYEDVIKQDDIHLNDEYSNGFKRLDKVLGGNTQLILELGNKIIEMFSKEQMDEIIEFAGSGKIVELREVIHKLKGAISNFKLTKVTENLNTIKEMAIAGDINSIYNLIDEINGDIGEFKKELIKYCNN
ncbi:response regulator [Clostridium lundense]|uniref:response regulator n=1 Tax=Clostridium lundense TaxID=319475 RepID=UPI000688D36B|nr:response regulator [Clostridium lundense]